MKPVWPVLLEKHTAVIPEGLIFANTGEATCGRNGLHLFPMDEQHLLATARYIEMNPVAAGIAVQPADYRWSSTRAHLKGDDDELVVAAPLLELLPDWEDLLRLSTEEELKALKLHERTGRPLGNAGFVEKLEQSLGRILQPPKPGPKKRKKGG